MAQNSHDALRAEEEYFSTNPPPSDLDKIISLANAFVSHHLLEQRRVVLVTSGGTIVPLEKQMVRFIDNFSAGTRGATSAEYFLQAGYAVIFLHRQFSLQPYTRHYSHATDTFLDLMVERSDGSVTVRDADAKQMIQVLRKYQHAKERNLLLSLQYVSINDYLHYLRAISRAMKPLKHDGLLYLAAAVSDFFLPPNRVSEHKIQSTNYKASASQEEEFDNFDSSPQVPREKQLVINLDAVPKFLKNLVDDWSSGMVVSFKLETDPTILIEKAKYALNRYSHDLVIGNLLSTRKWEVVFVAPGKQERWLRLPGYGPDIIPSTEPDVEVESLIVPAVVQLHDEFIQSRQSRSDR